MRQELIEARKATGMTQEQVAQAVGIDRSAYNRIERGYQNPPVDVALSIARLLGKRVEDIFLPAVVQEMHTDEQAATLEPTGT